MSETPIVSAMRQAIKAEALDRFTSEYLADDAREWLAGFASRAAARVMAEQLNSLAADWEHAAAEDERYLNRAHVSEVHEVQADINMNRRHAKELREICGERR